jgi:hypothetical protein
MVPAMMKLGSAYYHLSPLLLAREVVLARRMKLRPEPLIFGFSQLLKDWTVMDRLSEQREKRALEPA